MAFEVLAKIDKSEEPDEAEQVKNTARGTLALFHEAFQYSKKEGEKITLNIMTEDSDHNPRQLKLYTSYAPHKKSYVCRRLDIDASAAGLAFSAKRLVYIPSTYFIHGLSFGFNDADIKDYDWPTVEEKAFTGITRNFKSLICVPIKRGATNFGVLNIESNRRNAFRRLDLRIARVAASVAAIVLDKAPHPA